MEYDVAQFRLKAPALSVTTLPAVRTRDGVAIVCGFKGDAFGNHEAVAYIDEKLTIVMPS